MPFGVEFTLSLGEALHRYGTPSHRLEATLKRVSDRLNLDARFFATPTVLQASFGPPSDLRSSFARVDQGVVDLERLALLDEVAEKVVSGTVSLEEGALSVGAILAAAPRYGTGLTILCSGLAGGAAARLLGGSYREMAVAGFSSLAIGVLSALSERLPAIARVLEAVAALASSILAVVVASLWGHMSVSIATLSGLVVLLPGLSLTVAMNELATGHLMSGTARLMGAALTFLKLGFGVAVGTRLAEFLPLHPSAGHLTVPRSWSEAPALVVMTLAVCVLLKLRPRDVTAVALAGALGYWAARLGTLFLGFEMGAFAGAFVLGATSNVLARIRNVPSGVTVMPGLILLVPGSVGFRSLESLVSRNVLDGVDTGFSMMMAAVALVAGLLFANALIPSRQVQWSVD